MKWQIPVKLDSKNRITLPKEIIKKINTNSDFVIEYDQGQPHIISIVIIKKEEDNK
jgi:bifunctional DNA-binding transcriptional regulator/antitoxin component of YhaV-PrlF toxin-antitoxin module